LAELPELRVTTLPGRDGPGGVSGPTAAKPLANLLSEALVELADDDGAGGAL